MQILFLGRDDCVHTHSISDFMNELGHTVLVAPSKEVGQELPGDILKSKGDLLISYRSHFIVPPAVLSQYSSAINFHIGPPEYPGFGSASFALWNGEREFGVTAHRMNERPDSGEILAVQRFPIEPADDLPSLLAKSHSHASGLVKHYLANGDFPKITRSKSEWGKIVRTRKTLESLSRISSNDSADQIELKIRAFDAPGWPVVARLGHGREFVLVKATS